MKNKRKRRSILFVVIILLAFGLVGSTGTLIAFYAFPISVLTCSHVEPGQVDCILQERIIGVIPTQEISIVNLKEAHVVSEIRERRQKDGKEDRERVDRMILSSNSGTVALGSSDEFHGIFAEQSANKINNFILTPTDKPLRIWQVTWVPIVVSSFFFFVSIMMLYGAVDISVRRISGKIR